MFPEEIISDILTRIPIKSLVRFLSLSKSWNSLIFHPNFVKTHLTRSINQNPNYHDNLITLKSNGVRIISRYIETRVYLLPFLVHNLIGSINGLVCVYRSGKFWLWNPVIYKFKEFMPPENKNLYTETKKCNRYSHLVGFGWDRLSNDFKLVSCYVSFRSKKCVVYSSSLDTWTELLIDNSVFPSYLFRSDRTVRTPVTVVNNCPYWRYSYYHSQKDDNCTALVKFEVETNMFRLLPEFDYAAVKGKKIDFVNINDSLAAMVCKAWVVNDRQSTIGFVDVYILDEVSSVWSKMYTVGPINISLPIRNFSQGFKYGGEIVFNKAGKLFSYDPKTDVVNDFLGSSSFHIEDCFSYTPTLVFLPGMKAVKYFNGT